jgi:hypothetical protein
MEKSTAAAEALRVLAKDSANRTKIGRLREIIAEIETAQKAGVHNSKIVETLNEQGFELTLKTFETMLYRIRRRRKQDGYNTYTRTAASQSSQIISTSEDLEKLDRKQRRERLADQFIKPENINPLLQHVMEKKK